MAEISIGIHPGGNMREGRHLPAAFDKQSHSRRPIAANDNCANCCTLRHNHSATTNSQPWAAHPKWSNKRWEYDAKTDQPEKRQRWWLLYDKTYVMDHMSVYWDKEPDFFSITFDRFHVLCSIYSRTNEKWYLKTLLAITKRSSDQPRPPAGGRDDVRTQRRW